MKVFKPFTNKYVHDLKHMKVGDHVLHGDLSIYKIESLPSDFDSMKDMELGVLAEGEAHAHAHQLFDNAAPELSKPAFQVIEGGNSEGVKFALKAHPDGHMYLKVENEPLLLKHQTHENFRIYPGNYDVDFQVEEDYWSDELRRIAD